MAQCNFMGSSSLKWSNHPIWQDDANWNSWTEQSVYHTFAFCLVEPLKLVWLCELLPPVNIDCPICPV